MVLLQLLLAKSIQASRATAAVVVVAGSTTTAAAAATAAILIGSSSSSTHPPSSSTSRNTIRHHTTTTTTTTPSSSPQQQQQQRPNRFTAAYSAMQRQCPQAIAAYSACIQANADDLLIKNTCQPEFEAVRACFRQARATTKQKLD